MSHQSIVLQSKNLIFDALLLYLAIKFSQKKQTAKSHWLMLLHIFNNPILRNLNLLDTPIYYRQNAFQVSWSKKFSKNVICFQNFSAMIEISFGVNKKEEKMPMTWWQLFSYETWMEFINYTFSLCGKLPLHFVRNFLVGKTTSLWDQLCKKKRFRIWNIGLIDIGSTTDFITKN